MLDKMRTLLTTAVLLSIPAPPPNPLRSADTSVDDCDGD